MLFLLFLFTDETKAAAYNKTIVSPKLRCYSTHKNASEQK
jgi:hypothetical protein